MITICYRRPSAFSGSHEMAAYFKHGSYALILFLESHSVITVGKLGAFDFPMGWYTYVGSAFGPGGLAGSLKHHLNPDGPSHWHIDYLCRRAAVREFWVCGQRNKREHDWALAFEHLSGVSIAVKGFGSSDCHCPSHLFRSQQFPSFEEFRRSIREKFPRDSKISRYEVLGETGEPFQAQKHLWESKQVR